MIKWNASFKNKSYDKGCIVHNNKDCADGFPFKLIIDNIIFKSSELTDWELDGEQENNKVYRNFDLFKNKYLQNFTLNIFIDTLVFDTEINEQIKSYLHVTYIFGKADDNASARGCNYATLDAVSFC